MKKCELCDSLAAMFCESDQARLCWNCDSNVHSANFLVAKHKRTLLCSLCQSLTPWTGSGPKLAPTVTCCELCENGNNSRCESESPNEEEDDDVDNEIDDGDDDEEENQVVPWAVSSSASTSTAGTSASLRGPQQVSSSSNAADQECSSSLFNRYQSGASVSRRGFPLK